MGSGAVELATRKANGVVRFWEGWYGARDGVTIPPIAARILSGDSTSLLTREARVLAICYILRNWQSVHLKARVMVQGEGWGGNPSKFAMRCTATEKLGDCAVPD